MITQTKETQSQLTPDAALQLLKEGNKRFVNSEKTDRNLGQQVKETAGGQYPFAAILSCMDSRVSAELIFDQGIGDIFSIRIAGNIVNEDVLGSLEYAAKAVGTKVVMVLGHTKCGAVTGACNHVEMGNLTALLHKIQPAIDRETETTGARDGSNADFVRHVTELNVQLAIEQIRTESPIIAELEQQGQVKLVGAMYDVASGEVAYIS